jgi:hypothetical protein
MRAHFGLPSITGTLQLVRCAQHADRHCNTNERFFLAPDLFCLYCTYKGEDAEHWRAPIEVKFEIPYFTVSGLQVGGVGCIN